MDGSLYINYSEPIVSWTVDPSGALNLSSISTTDSQWKGFRVTPSTESFGRARLTIQYADQKIQTVHYFLTDTGANTASKLGDFLFTKQWFSDSSDPFHRSPSVISYDYEAQAQVLQEYRAWIAGISDEAGAGSFVAAAMKSSVYPEEAQIQQLEEMVRGSVWGWLQDTTTGGIDVKYGVKRSLFFYDPTALPNYPYDPSINFGGTWDRNNAWAVWRAYDYVHVSALYWGLYQAEISSPGILKVQNATWYLTQAYHTVMESQASVNGTPVTAYGDDGLMGETVWLKILLALKAEGLNQYFEAMQTAMQSRERAWAGMAQPYGSEMAWDSTGQEGVYLWAKYFNDTDTATKTLNSIRGYMPTVPHWGWNGCARRYWDFLTGGKFTRIERMIHHYGSGLNALPMLDSYKYDSQPSSISAIYDLRIGYGGTMGPLSNINSEGLGAQAFHSWPDTMAWEAYSGDYGPNFLGHILGAATYLVDHPNLGLISMGGNIVQQGDNVEIQPRDTVRQRIYVAPVGLSVEINAGVIESFTYQPSSKSVIVQVKQANNQTAKSSVLTYEDTLSTGVKLITNGLPVKGNGYKISLPTTLRFEIQ